MRNNVERILSKVTLHINQETYDNLIDECGRFENGSDLTEQGKYIALMLEKLSGMCGEEKVAEIMQSCGASCIGSGAIDKANELYADSIDMDDFLQKLNQTGIGGGKLHIDKLIRILPWEHIMMVHTGGAAVFQKLTHTCQ